MEQLRELEKRVFDIIQKNKDIANAMLALKSENVRLQEQVKQFETSLLKESKSTQSLESEKTSIAKTIDELLETISSLDVSE